MASAATLNFKQVFGIDLPIIQGPMSGTSGPELVAAVTGVGGLGILPIWGRSVDDAKAMIAATKALTDGPLV